MTRIRQDLEHILREVDADTERASLHGLIRARWAALDPRLSTNYYVDVFPPLEQQQVNPERMFHDLADNRPKHIAVAYCHLPFCLQRCNFCPFSVSTDASDCSQYMLSLRKEVAACLRALPRGTSIGSVYIGGGTPSLVPAEELVELLAEIRGLPPCASLKTVTLEIHAGAMSPNLDILAREGLTNRISIGIQTFSPGVLVASNRVPVTPNAVMGVVSRLTGAGITKVNLDFLVGLRQQTVSDVMDDIEKVYPLLQSGLVDSVTVYARRFTEFSRIYPDEAITPFTLFERCRMEAIFRGFFVDTMGWHEEPMCVYRRRAKAPRRLGDASSARPGGVVGFGNSAYSSFDGANFRNTYSYGSYLTTMRHCRGATMSWQRLTPIEMIKRDLVLGAKRGYISQGTSEFLTERQREDIEKVHGRLIQEGLCRRKAGGVSLTRLGRIMSDWVIQQYRLLAL